jgi:predicted pyridoxine 5'-phosphate oxidase superfamily flavin-nucleotide-binding protein
VHVADARTLMLRDLGVANRLDSLRNLLCGPGQIGIIVMMPGFGDFFRINRRAEVRVDADLLAGFVEFG